MKICGKCLHAQESHIGFNGNGKYMYCANCNKICPIEEYSEIHPHDNQLVGQK